MEAHTKEMPYTEDTKLIEEDKTVLMFHITTKLLSEVNFIIAALY